MRESWFGQSSAVEVFTVGPESPEYLYSDLKVGTSLEPHQREARLSVKDYFLRLRTSQEPGCRLGQVTGTVGEIGTINGRAMPAFLED